MFYLTTHEPEHCQTQTRHFATPRAMLDAAKEFVRTSINDDDVFESLIQRHNAEAATARRVAALAARPSAWSHNDEMAELVELFKDELAGNCPDIIWGEVSLPAAEDPHTIERLLLVSLEHVPWPLRGRMDPGAPLPMFASSEWGAFFHTGLVKAETLEDAASDPSWDACCEADFGSEVAAVLAYARKLGCNYVRFDAEGPEYPALPTFDYQPGMERNPPEP